MNTKNICILLLSIFLSSCQGTKQATEEEPELTDLAAIKAQGEITAVTLYSSTSYFQYRGEMMGYEYDLIKGFAESEGLTLEIKVAENLTRLVEMLLDGEADVVAYPIQYDNTLRQDVIYCGKEEISTQVLVQRAIKGDEILTDVTQLIGQDVHVKANTKYHQRLINLNNELGGGIQIQEIERDTVTNEDLIEMVSRGEIGYTISDDKTAKLNKTYYWNIHIDLPVSFPQRSSWIVRKDCPQLAEAINDWAESQVNSYSLKGITKRYFELSKRPAEGNMPVIQNGHISPFDHLFRKHATSLDWDWQLLASICYQESKFNIDVVSWAGAQGLMGIMPNTAKAFGVTPHELNDPDVAIHTGVQCLLSFRKGFTSISDPMERIKFTLASYNAGIGHIYDAQRLAEKHGKNPHVWDNNVAEFIRLKADPEYYNDPVCKHGYLRGTETYKYVTEVLERYNYYKRQTL